MNNNNKNIGQTEIHLPLAPVVGVIALVVIALSLGLFISKNVNELRVKAITNSVQYLIGDNLKITIKNNSNNKICFSSCYPYYFEKKEEGSFKVYSYADCEKEDISEKCLEPKKTKSFDLLVSSIEEGKHRLAIPVCIACSGQDPFKRNEWVYSNEFNIIKR